ncbi:MAG: hypothetical protein A4E40_01413 [Methanoregulaceae archaeon PtaU1.Bin059]|nr:MAG: hypothetical protein A4E39_00371 [Methanoregulaceae archaeon PtaB.Bin152]OPY36999.1 MAG: hypothetical protein A4E40_01413 [Methanoregulaceae archaeon PtaU1.Bin059]
MESPAHPLSMSIFAPGIARLTGHLPATHEADDLDLAGICKRSLSLGSHAKVMLPWQRPSVFGRGTIPTFIRVAV